MGRLLRLDKVLVDRGLAASRQRARALIEEGVVLVDGVPAKKVAAQIRPEQNVHLAKPDFPWVGRGALKLIGALDGFEVCPKGRVAADLGASTGGFTEVLLHRGAHRVYAIDVGRGQLAWRLRTDPRVVNMEGTNVRHLEGLPEPASLIVGDLSFISLRLILPAVARLGAPSAEAVLLVKPQFEVGRSSVASGGRVSSPEAREQAIARVREDAVSQGFEVLGSKDCVLPGAKAGNVEHFLHLRLNPRREDLSI
ncbi:MAG: TlyA family RNA methyltransferase [Myxococcota bacterium]